MGDRTGAPPQRLVLTSEALAEHQKALDEARLAGSRLEAGIHTVPTWCGGMWRVRRDGKIVPDIANVPDYDKERTINAIYEGQDIQKAFGRRQVMHYDFHRHRPLAEVVGAVCPPDVVERLIAQERQKTEDTMKGSVGRGSDEHIEQKVQEREDTVRAKNPPRQPWDADMDLKKLNLGDRRIYAELYPEAPAPEPKKGKAA